MKTGLPAFVLSAVLLVGVSAQEPDEVHEGINAGDTPVTVVATFIVPQDAPSFLAASICHGPRPDRRVPGNGYRDDTVAQRA